MPAWIAAHPYLTFFIALAALGVIDDLFLKGQSAAAPVPPGTPTTTSGYPWNMVAGGRRIHTAAVPYTRLAGKLAAVMPRTSALALVTV